MASPRKSTTGSSAAAPPSTGSYSVTHSYDYEERKTTHTITSPGRSRTTTSAFGSPGRRAVTPSSFSPSRIFARPGHSTAAAAALAAAAPRAQPVPVSSSPAPGSPRHRPLPIPHTSPLSPREQARMEIARHTAANTGTVGTGTGALGRSTAHGIRSPHLTSPLRSPYEPGATVGSGAAYSSFMASAQRSKSLSPRRFNAVAAESRSRAAEAAGAAAAGLDATMRFENLEPSPVRRTASPPPASRSFAATSPSFRNSAVRAASASPVRSPTRFASPNRFASPTRFGSSRPAPLDSAASRQATAALAAATSNLAAATSHSGVYVHAPLEPWRELNKQLALHGFPMVHPFPVPVSVAPTESLPWSPASSRMFRAIPQATVNATPSASLTLLLTTCTNLVADYARRGKQIEELMKQNAETSSSHLHCHAEIAALRRTNQQQAYQISDLQQSLEHSSLDRANTLQSLSSQLDQSAHNFSNLEAKYSAAQAQLQRQEEAVAGMRFKLEEAGVRAEKRVAAEAERAATVLREKEISNAHVAHTAQVALRELEHQLRETQIALTAAQAGKTAAEEDANKREAHATYMGNVRALESEERLHAAQLAHEQEVATLRARARDIEADLSAKLRATEESLGLTTGQVAELTSLNGLLRSDLATAHSQSGLLEEQVAHLKQETRLHAELQQTMEEKVAALQAQAVAGYNLQELQRHLSGLQSSQLLRRDKLAQSFEVGQLHSLPKEVLEDILVGVCRALKVGDATQVASALDSLIAVASAVPGMQDFIGQIWAVVNGGDSGSGSSSIANLSAEDLISLTTSVVPTLRSWQYAASQTKSLQVMRTELLDVLRRRQHRSPLNPLHSGSGSGAGSSSRISDELPNEEILLELNDIVANENRLNALVYDQNTPSGFFQLWAAMDKSPLLDDKHYSTDSDKIIAHLQQLFDIPHRIGLFPKINELFLFVNETRPAIQAMRSLLRLDSKATIHTCIKQLKRVVEGGGSAISSGLGLDSSFAASSGPGAASSSYRTSHSPARTRPVAWTVSSPSKHEQSFLLTTPGAPGEPLSLSSSAPSSQQMQRNAHYYTVCKQLKTVLGVKKIAEIVPTVQKMQQAQGSQNHHGDYLSASILAQLKAMLEVSSVADIPSAVSWLRNSHEVLQRRVDAADDNAARAARATSGVVANELSKQLDAKREEFLGQLKTIAGVPGEDDAVLVSALQRLVRSEHSGGGGGGGGVGIGAGVGRSSFPSSEEHSTIVMQLKGYLGVSSISEIVNTVRTLINKVHSYDELYPKLDYMVSQLYALLNISTLEAIVPSVRTLLTAGRGPVASSSSSVRGTMGSVENSPTLSAISAISDVSQSHSQRRQPTGASSSSAALYSAGRPSAAGAGPSSSSASAYPSKSPYRGVTFDSRESGGEDPLAMYAPSPAAHPQPTSALKHASGAPRHASSSYEVDAEIDRTLQDGRRH